MTDRSAANPPLGTAVKAYRYDYELIVNDIWTPYETFNRDLTARDRRSFTDVAAYTDIERTRAGRLLAGVRGGIAGRRPASRPAARA